VAPVRVSPRRARCRHDPTDHQEKTIVIDDELAFVGGIDMTDLAGDRFDVSAHPARRCLGWHDVATQSRGPAVGDVAEHFAMR
jgi:phosphatidylserine/phosphatidylglycerophosphate/cardiolipin synthase-like enzyme